MSFINPDKQVVDAARGARRRTRVSWSNASRKTPI